MSRTITVTWADDAITGAIERAAEICRETDPDEPCEVSWMDLACLVDLGRHALSLYDSPAAPAGSQPLDAAGVPSGDGHCRSCGQPFTDNIREVLADPRYEVRQGPSLYMSGMSDWHVREVGRPGIRATFLGSTVQAQNIERLLNGEGGDAA